MSVRDEIASSILGIMAEYHRQEESGYVDSPGGLEHIGDVWKLFKVWDRKLREEAAGV